MFNNELQFTSLDISSVQSIDCFLSTFWSVFFIHWIIVANKPEFPDIIWLKNTRLDVSKRFKHFFYLSVSPIVRNIFDVNIVDQLSLGKFNIFWFEFTHFKLSWLVLYSVSSRLYILETYKSVSSWRVIFIDWGFHALNFTKLFEDFMQFRIFNFVIFWKFNKHILRIKFFSVWSKNLLVKR